MNVASQPFQLVFYSEFLFFEGRDPVLVPIRMRHLVFDKLFKFLMLFGQLVDMPLQCHSRTSFLWVSKVKHHFTVLSRASSVHPF